jgi:hypothetical protein
MRISNEREYVLVSVKWTRSFLMFWGSETKDDEKRSFGGYTMDIKGCEKYTKSELEERGHKFWNNEKYFELDKTESYGVKLNDLDKFGQRKEIIWM